MKSSKTYPYPEFNLLDFAGERLNQLPFSLRILLENAQRHSAKDRQAAQAVDAIHSWQPQAEKRPAIPFYPARVLLQDLTGVPLVVDLAAMRSAYARLGGDPAEIAPKIPVDLVIDHSVQVDEYGTANAYLFNKEMEQKVSEFSAGAMNLMMNHDWPGNVRELENVVHRAVILANDKVIRQGHLVNLIDMLPHISLDVPRTSEELKRIKKIARQKSVENVEKHFVLGTLKRNGRNVTKSAEQTGMQRSNFQALMAKYDIRMRSLDQNGDEEGSG